MERENYKMMEGKGTVRFCSLCVIIEFLLGFPWNPIKTKNKKIKIG